MVSFVKIYKKIGRAMPKGYREYLEKKLVCCGIPTNVDIFIGFTLLLSLLLSFIISLSLFLVGFLNFLYFVIAFLGILCVSVLVEHAVLVLIADRKASFVDEILPDALQLMAANIRAGITPDRALLLAARPEFGPLEIEIKRAAKEALTGRSIEDALLEVPKRIESKMLNRAIRLIVEGLRSGGELATLLDETANDARQTQSLRKEVRANVAMYGMFILFAVAIGAPLLYAISTHLVEMIIRVSAGIQMPEVTGTAAGLSMIKFASPNIDPQFIFNFSIAAIIITTTFGGIIIGLIEAGKEKAGIKFVFALIAVGILVFIGMRYLLASMFLLPA
ncbi:MAG: type II secretion system F family protein [Candidatus Aenigmatarchaeota archaeon]